MGIQGLANHMYRFHPEERATMDYKRYIKENTVKQRDTEHPLRHEWRVLHDGQKN